MTARGDAERRVRVDDAAAFGRVAVLMGGSSAEREISLLTGEAVLAALRDRGVEARALDPAEEGIAPLVAGACDRVWIALHGRNGEDGKIQGALETLGVPYTGSDVLGSAVSMDKLRSKQLFVACGLETPDWTVMEGTSDVARVVARFGLPLIVKPAGEGSSVGMSKVDAGVDLASAWEKARRYDPCVLVERWVDAAEYSVGVLQGEALPVVRIETPRIFYDYDAKYLADDTQYHCPAGLDDAREAACRAEAIRAFDAVGAGGWGRVDFLMAEHGPPQILEVNTVPGMTSHSLVPMCARAVGIEFDELVWRILETSMSGEAVGDGA